MMGVPSMPLLSPGGALLSILAGGRRRAMVIGWCLAGTAVALRIPNLSCAAAVVRYVLEELDVAVDCLLILALPDCCGFGLCYFIFSRSTV